MLWSAAINVQTMSIQTRRPLCRKEQPHDAGHLYRNLAPNPRATQWIETTLKLSANIEKLSKNHVRSVGISVKDWCMSPHCITGPQTKVHEIREVRVDWPDPLTLPNFVALRQKVCEISDVVRCGKNCSQKSTSKVTLGHQICQQPIGCTRVFIDTV